jgi:hypothetical protein
MQSKFYQYSLNQYLTDSFPCTFAFLPLLSFSALMLLAIVDLEFPEDYLPAVLLAIAALTAAAFSSSVNSLAGSADSVFYYSAALAFFLSFFFLFLALPSPAFAADSASFFSSTTASGLTSAIKASNSASSFAFCSFFESYLTGLAIDNEN